MRLIGLMIWLAAIALGIAAEAAAFAWDEPRYWVPDLLVGLTFIGCGSLAWHRQRAAAAGALLAATGVTWFLGDFSADLLYLHRGFVVHLILAYPGWRPGSRLGFAAIAVGYATAIATPLWHDEVTTLVLAALFVAVAVRRYATAGAGERRQALFALQAAATLGVALIGGALARLALPAGDVAEPVLFVYEAALVAMAVGLYAGLRGPAASTVADLVVELGDTRSGTLRDRLARALGDPTLEVGYWSADAGMYLDGSGHTLATPPPGSGRSATHVEREGSPFAVVVHDSTVLRDAAMIEAVASATRLSASNVVLQDEVRARATQLAASRRRLLVAADRERRRLEARLHKGPERRLTAVAEAIARIAPLPAGQTTDHLQRAQGQLSRTLDDLHEIALGLHPRELTEGGPAKALAALAESAPLPVELDVTVDRLPDELAATVYFLCAEALANVAKYASASRAELQVTARGDRLSVVVADDGVGGADSSRGTGLRGLADRVEALGGELSVTSPVGHGTRLVAEIPVGDEL